MHNFFPLTTTQNNFITAEQITGSTALSQMLIAITSDIPFDIVKLRVSINAVINQRAKELRMQVSHERKKTYHTRDFDLYHGCLFVEDDNLHQAISRWSTQRPIAFTDDELVRFNLLEISTGGNLFLIESSHILWDGISAGIFLNHLLEIYAATSNVSILYHDDYNMFVEELHGYYDSSAYQRSLNYWKTLLLEVPTVARLPLNKKHSSRKLKKIESRYLPLSELQNTALLTNKHPLARFLSAFCMFYQHSTLQEKLIVGIPYAGRSHERLKGQIGLYENTLPLLLTGAMAMSGGEMLIRKQLLSNSLHQLFSLNDLIKNLNIKIAQNTHPIFQILVNYVDLTINDNNYTRLFISNRTSLFTLSLHLLKISDKKFSLQIEYDSSVYTDNEIDIISSGLLNAIAGELSEPDVPVNPLSSISHLSTPPLQLTRDESVLGWLEQITARFPDKICVRSPTGTSLTFAQLQTRSKELAEYFQSKFLFAHNEKRIVACDLTRTVDSIAVLVALLRSHMAFMPMDHKFPAARKKKIIEASQCRFLVADRTLEWIDEDAHKGIINVNVSLPLPVITGSPTNFLSAKTQMLAYCLYTSGSTGTPKGVMLSHGNLTAFIAWSLTAGDKIFRRVPFITSFSFDLSIYEIFATLCSGGCLTVLDNALQLRQHDNFTLLNTVPSVLEYLLEHRAFPQTLLRVNVAGEALSPNLVKRYFAFAKNMPDFYNLYGPTEFTTYATEYHITSFEDTTPIGVPLPGNQVAIIGDEMALLPRGQIGQIVLSGLNLASGYMHAPELTLQRFVFLNELNDTVYLTGDNGYIDDEGRLHYVGRQDNQVKIHGHRVELSEVELAAESLGGVGRAIACIANVHGHKEIILCVVAESGFSIDQGLIASLREILPVYMVPSFIYVMDSFPLNHNGKIDRKELLIRSQEWVGTLFNCKNPPEYNKIPSKEVVEEKLMTLCCAILSQPTLDIKCDLIASGASSLDILKLLEGIKATFSIRLDYEDIFAAPAINELAISIFHRLTHTPPAVQFKEGQEIIFLPGAGTLGAVYQPWFKKLAPEFNVKLINYNSYLQVVSSFDELADKTWEHLIELPQYGQKMHFIGHSFGGGLAYEMARRSIRQGQQCIVTIIDSFLDFMPFNYLPDTHPKDEDIRFVSLNHLLNRAISLHRQFRIYPDEELSRNINLIYARDGVGRYLEKDEIMNHLRRLGAANNITLVDGDHFSLFHNNEGECVDIVKRFHRNQ